MKNPLLAPELRRFLSEGDLPSIREFCTGSHPGDVADFLSALAPEEIWQILIELDPDLRVEIFSNLDDDLQLEIAETLGREELARLIADMSPDDRVDLFKQIPEDRREKIMPALAQAEREDIRRLASYPEGSAGAAMTSDYAVLPPHITVAEALARLRREAPDKETIYYCYVVDDHRRLIGFVSLKDLILAAPATRIADIMYPEVIFARVTDDQEEAARKIQKYDLLALPVVNGNDALVGIITHDDAFDIITQEQTEDMEKLMAITGSHAAGVYLRTPVAVHVKNRIGWLIILALLGLVSGYIVQSFEGLLMQFAILATFMPMLADTGGNAGSQSATLVIRALALEEINYRDVLRVVWKEFRVALPLALMLAALAYGRVILFGNHTSIPSGFSLTSVGAAVAVALGLQVATSTLIGAVLPLGAARLKQDPALVASPALTTIVDITGLMIYFFTAKWMLGI